MTQSPKKTITLYQVVGHQRPDDTKPELNELVFQEAGKGGWYKCDGIVQYTLDSEDATVVHDYHTGMSIQGPDHPLEEYMDNEFWTRDKKLAKLAVALLTAGIKRGLDLAKHRLGFRAALLIDAD